MAALEGFALADLKLVYRVLHEHVLEHEELMDSELFHQLQALLQAKAREEGVELADHTQWDGWLRR